MIRKRKIIHPSMSSLLDNIPQLNINRPYKTDTIVSDETKQDINDKMKLFYFDIELFKELNLHLELSKLYTLDYLENDWLKKGIPNNIKYSIYDIYPDFDWIKYKLLNPYLYIIGLRKKEEYEKNYILEGQYKGRHYLDEHEKISSIHVLLATIGKRSIFKILKSLLYQLNENDFLTIVFDSIDRDNIIKEVDKMSYLFKCKVNIIFEEKNLGYWGHGIRNKHKNLEGEFVFHIDDDDDIYIDTFYKIRKYCKNKNIIYIFKIVLENNSVVWDRKLIKIGKISTQSGLIPIEINKEGYWELKYGGDYNFYYNLSQKYNVVFINEIIYKKFNS
jgi:hypothetical protein